MASRAVLGRWQRAGIAAAVAYALVLQALLFAFGGTLHAEAGALPPGIICAHRQDDGAPAAPAPAHDALCCALSCNVPAPPLGPVPVCAGIAPPVRVPVVAGPVQDAPLLRLWSRVLPVGSRAPPRRG